MPTIPTYVASTEPIERDTASENPQALAQPGLAAERAGREVSQVGEGLGRLQEWRNFNYVYQQRGDATVQAHANLQNAMDQARQSGDYAGFAQNFQAAAAKDLQQRIANAPSSRAKAELTRYFGPLQAEVNGRAATFEHQMEANAAAASGRQLTNQYSKLVYRDPSQAHDLASHLVGGIAGNLHQGVLTPEQAQTEMRLANNSIWSAQLLGRTATDPVGAMADFKAGKYDPYLDAATIEGLKPQLENAVVKGIIARLPIEPGAAGAADGAAGAGAGASAPQPGATDDQADAALAPVVQRESAGSPYAGYAPSGSAPVDLTNAPLDATGFPIWNGNKGPHGISHAAGLYQIEPGTWRPIAQKLGITDFSPESQRAVARELYREQGLAPWAASAPGGGASGGGLAALYGRIDRMGLDPDVAMKVKAAARVNYAAAESDQLRAQRTQELAQRAQLRQAQDQVIADAYSGDPQITARQIADDPRFDANPDERLKMIQVIRNGASAGVAAGPSHQAALSLLDRMRKPEGDPMRITTEAPILDALVHDQISKGDFDFVKKQFDQQQTADGEIFAKREANFLKSIEPQIDKSLLAGVPDVAGKERFYQFQWALDQKIDEYHKAGKNPADLLDPSKSDYMGKPEALQPYRRSVSQLLSDLPGAAKGPDLTTQAGIVAAYRAGKISRADASQALVKGGFAAAPPAPVAQPEPPLGWQ